MNSLIPPSYYTDPQIFERELRLFERVWRIVGIRELAANDEDWFTTRIGARSVVVQNFEGELRAFANVCSHRWSQLRLEGSGNGMLQCQYHGWIYNKEGIPYSIPRKPRFDSMTEQRKCELALERYELEPCGRLLFARRKSDKGGPTLREYLGPMFELFERVSTGLGPVVDTEQRVWAANWKVCMENLLEAYHIPFVHKETLNPLGIGQTGTLTFEGDHAVYESPIDEERRAAFDKMDQGVLKNRTFRVPGWYHLYAFPVSTIATTYGASFNIPQFIPLAPDKTLFINHVFGCNVPNATARERAVISALNGSVAASHRQVFQEDEGICARVQLGLPDATVGGVLSEDETRLHLFHASYMKAMDAASGSPQ